MTNPIGRPSKYNDTYPNMLFEHMEGGLSYESFAGLIGVSKQTIYDWEKVHPDFLDAKQRGVTASLLAWEMLARDHMFGIGGSFTQVLGKDGNMHNIPKPFDTRLWSINMKNRFRPFGWNENDTMEEVEKFKKPPEGL